MATIFKANIAVIIVVALIDIYLSIKLAETLPYMELNIIGRWLIYIDNGSVALFMCCKIIGTSLVIYILCQISKCRPDMAEFIAFVLSLFQICLVIFLFGW